jgi:hypothetical protein
MVVPLERGSCRQLIMKHSRLYKAFSVAIVLSASARAMMMMRSFRFDPDPSGDLDFIARAQQKSAPGIKVSASALGARESKRSFGENLAKHDIQPVWLSIENETDDQLVYLPIAMDPEYYSPYEVAYRFHGVLSFTANRARDAFFLQRQMSSILPPHSHTAGFVYGVLDAGVKYAHILIAGNNRLETFDFALPVPGAAFVGTSVRADSIYPDQKVEDLDLDTLKMTLAKYACCTTDFGATRNGDPLNLVVVEGDSDLIVPFIARGWHLARKLDVASMIETVRAFIFREEYLTSPVSPLYLRSARRCGVAESTIDHQRAYPRAVMADAIHVRVR